MLLLDQGLLILLQSLEFNLLFGNQLDRELTGLVYNGKICLFLSFTCCWSLHDTVQHNGAGVDVVYFEELLTDGNLAAKDGVDIQSQKLSNYQLHLGSYQSLLYHGISGDIEVRFIEILSCRPQYILILLFIILIVQCLLQGLLLLCKGIQLLGGDHSVNMGYITQWGSHEGSQHFWIGQDVLIEGDGIVGVTKLGLAVSEDASNSDGAGISGQPMTAKGGFVFLIKDWVHSLLNYYKMQRKYR